MAKKDKTLGDEKEDAKEMSLEEAKAYRASFYKPTAAVASDQDKREQFRLFWAQEKSKYGKSKDLEQILWVHLKASKLDEPENFEKGVQHFGLQKVK